ncbi:TetR/AcrR family transcriptional regulator [Brevundimonas subvibrioides]|uniref:Regulatory protein TetR n=1 Tax=Brevundimonas subvibrioides (strain ATCC 15264 / DSM 4735 / LMG 14903 / NBRC 16000 / CB 81) TaxID=633149 RepID=D9QIK8_BRESC|nr:TetR/AcrR family transcriptional regulator [Brevundimonas subvibrioides]ADL01341.1 regulatory protein TetR [Brevundimonas subvibrioides ATCC 15264]
MSPTSDKTSGIGKRRKAAKEESSDAYKRRRREIAEAAVRVFDRLGLQGASISAVAAELGIDRASVYYYISSKEELFDEVLRAVAERNSQIAIDIAASALPAPDKLWNLIVSIMESYGEHYPLLFIYIRENLGRVSGTRSKWSSDMRQVNRIIENAFISIIEEGYADGTLRDVGPSRVVSYGMLGVVGWTHRWFRPETSPQSAREIGETYANMMVSGMRA